MLLKLKTIFIIYVLLCIFSCRHKSVGINSSYGAPKTSDSTSKSNYNIYIDNSVSMDGYVNQSTFFKSNLMKFTVDISNGNLTDSLNINFINNKTCPQVVNQSISNKINFISHLQTNFRKENCGDTLNSRLQDVIDTVISKKSGDINILISDCILSIGKDSKSELPGAEQNIRTYIYNHIKNNDISCVILKMMSQFNGKYFIENKLSRKELKVPLPNRTRPYYIIVFGNTNSIYNLLEKVQLSSLPGFQRSYYLMKPQPFTDSSKIVMDKNFTTIQPATRLIINNAKPEVDKNGNKIFQFSVATNLNRFKMDDSYLIDTNNYQLPSNYSMVSVSKNNNLQDQELAGFTHVITVKTNDLQQDQKVDIVFNPKMPKWVDTSTNEDDSNPLDSAQLTQTFGIRYLIEGIEAAYKDNSPKEQFKIPVTVSSGTGHTSSKSALWLIILIIAVLIIIVILKNKKS